MSPLFRSEHDRARELAAMRLDEPLEPGERDWLDAHLAWCAPCGAVADEYVGQRVALRALRLDTPEPPRDLWARTAAALDLEAARSDGSPRRGRPFDWRRLTLAPMAALAVVAVIVGSVLLGGLRGPSAQQAGAQATPIAMTAGEVRVVTKGADGSLRIAIGRYDEVCPIGQESCGSSTSLDDMVVAGVAPGAQFDALLSPNQDQLIVVDRETGALYAYAIPVPASPLPSPSVTAATISPRVTPSASAGPTPTPSAVPPSETPPATPSASPTGSADGSPSPSASPSVAASPSASPPASPSIEPTPSLATTPEPSPSGSPTPSVEPPSETPEPSATVAVSPAPDGRIEIANDVVVVGGVAAYSGDGGRFAFTARPADGSAGPDVYVWRTTEREAVAVTRDHASMFASWLGDGLLVSRVVDGVARSFDVDVATGSQVLLAPQPMWRPAAAPDGRTGAWWDGTVTRTADGLGWELGEGRLVLAPWPGAGGADARTRVLARGPMADWEVRWDATGSVLAVWLREPGAETGTLSLYAIDAETGEVDLVEPMLDAEPALGGFSLRTGRLAWLAPAEQDRTTVEVLAWSGDRVGQTRLSTQDGVIVVR